MRTVQLVHKIAPTSNDKERMLLAKSAGTARFAYNWASTGWLSRYRDGHGPHEKALRHRVNAVQPTNYSWPFEVSKAAKQPAVKNIGHAFKPFFHERSIQPRLKKKLVDNRARIDHRSMCKASVSACPRSRG